MHQIYTEYIEKIHFYLHNSKKAVSLQRNLDDLNNMAKTQSIIVKDTTIRSFTQNGIDYICITDIARQKNPEDPNGVVGNWMRNRNTLEYLGL